MKLESSCPLCKHDNILYRGFFHGRGFHRCINCDLSFVNPFFLLSDREEKWRYEQHNNEPDDPGYISFLNQLIEKLLPQIPQNSSGLDYGSGPVPALAMLLRKAGHSVACYDPFFEPSLSTLKVKYDFVTCCEVSEHFHQPGKEFERLHSLLKPGGTIALQTSFPPERDQDFAKWHYMRDPTHVSFYSPKSFSFIASDFGFSVISAKDNVIIMKQITTEE